MKHALRNLAAVVCLMMILLGSGTCMMMTTHNKKAACSDCTKHMPQQQEQPCWCGVHQQPSIAAAVTTLDQPALIAYFEAPVQRLDFISVLSSVNGLAGPPPLPPPITLRI
ncbi:MAG TPA: hypothetical protein VFE38_13370 [Edaphobacter sp.]|nr:hypothetical protein [Edaphobacter sp.]